jgi:acetoacetyl-[acyl-carrier protein] synthase
MVQAHGTGTPQNRVTESTLLSKVAHAFNIKEWPVAAIKSFVGHSLAAAAGDQLTATLGIWQHGIMPGIHTIDGLASDVETSRLSFALSEREITDRDYALINSKGFGGNNATAALLSPSTAEALLQQHHGSAAMKSWRARREAVAEAQSAIEARRLRGEWSPAYHFDEGVLTDAEVSLTETSITLGQQTMPLDDGIPEGWQIDG